jgi:L-iditol 2-dehydrogenase
MKAAVQYAPHDVRVEDVPEPAPGPGEIKVRIAYAGVCGTDPEIFEGRFALMKTPGWPKGPKIEGHEASGVIAEIGPGCVQGYRVGQRVAMGFRAACGACYHCRTGMEHFCDHPAIAGGSFAEFAIYRESLVYALPDEIDLRIGAMLEPTSVALHTIDLAGVRTGSTVAISGAGPIGLLSLQLALRSGAATVLVSEPVEAKRRLAESLGATHTVDPTAQDIEKLALELTEGRGFDVVIDASGNLRAAGQALDLAAPRGTVVWAAVYPDDVPVPVNAFLMYLKELTIRSVSLSPYSFTRALAMLPHLDLEPLISAVRPLEDLPEVLRTHRTSAAIKTLIQP